MYIWPVCTATRVANEYAKISVGLPYIFSRLLGVEKHLHSAMCRGSEAAFFIRPKVCHFVSSREDGE